MKLFHLFIYISVEVLLLQTSLNGDLDIPPQAPIFQKMGLITLNLSEEEKFEMDLTGEFAHWRKELNQISRNVFSEAKAYLGDELSLEDCLKWARFVHMAPHIANEEKQLAQIRYREAKRNLFPAVSFEVEAIEGSTIGEDFRGEGVSLNWQQPLWDGGKKGSNYRQAKLNLKRAQHRSKKIVLDLDLEVTKAYLFLWKTKLVLKERQKFLDEAERIWMSAQDRHSKNLMRFIDYETLVQLFQQLQSQIYLAEQEWSLAQLSLKQLLNVYDQKPLKINSDLSFENSEPSLQVCLKSALQDRPDYLLAELQMEMARLDKKRAKKETSFILNLDGKMGYRAEAFDSENLDFKTEFFIGVNGVLPLWDHSIESTTILQNTVPSAGQTTSTDFKSQTFQLNLFSHSNRAKRLEATIATHQALNEVEKAKRSILFEVGKSYFDFKRTEQVYLQTKTAYKLDAKRIKLVELQVGVMEGNLVDLMQALIKKSESSIEALNAQEALFLAHNRLNRAMGRGNDSIEEQEKIKNP